MTETEIALVRESFHQLVRRGEDFGLLFYDTLFREHPALRALFPHDMQSQQIRLVQVLRKMVDSLGRGCEIEGLDALARHHIDIKVQPEHFSVFGRALLDTVGAVLDESFTADMRAAWERAYTRIAGSIMRAMVTAH